MALEEEYVHIRETEKSKPNRLGHRGESARLRDGWSQSSQKRSPCKAGNENREAEAQLSKHQRRQWECSPFVVLITEVMSTFFDRAAAEITY